MNKQEKISKQEKIAELLRIHELHHQEAQTLMQHKAKLRALEMLYKKKED